MPRKFLRPCGDDALVKSARSAIYNFPGKESLFASIDVYLIDITWMSKMSWENDIIAEQTYPLQYMTGLQVTKGAEVTNSVSIGAEFKDLSLSMDIEAKTFTTYETTNTQIKTISLRVPPKSTVAFYQKRYRFKIKMFFILDAWGQEWNVGSQGGSDIERKECEVEIMSEDFLTTDRVLDPATGTIEVKTVSKADTAEARRTRKHEDLTQWSKDALSKIAIRCRRASVSSETGLLL
ncbi:hypothetical protein EDD18DRAFT_1463867 [Armillaria luteobubalina]|uniref:Uncharacterized protein n=1 Tax=Armillaria luteobubalina TaxID=153913 RepID=A0AA39Q2A8_9AGAR|nr:hypothetical protein EDD18DRAFT_1463867 [Armillaria luteobubalina]